MFRPKRARYQQGSIKRVPRATLLRTGHFRRQLPRRFTMHQNLIAPCVLGLVVPDRALVT
jgi:hypothetical protein